MKKFLCLLLILSIPCFSLTGCYDAKGLETLAYVVAIGLDKGENNTLKLSLQFAILNNSSSGGESSQSNSKSTVTTVECSSIDAGISLINSYTSKKVNLSHCKVLVMSEALCYDGVSEYILSLINNVELRPDCNVVVSRCEASDFLNNSIPTLETIPARYYELIFNSSKYVGYSDNVNIADFAANIKNTTCEAYGILGGINNRQSHNTNNSLKSYETSGSYKADETPIKSSTNLENMGLAVFHGDKLVGELTGIEALCNLIVTNNLENATISIPSPFDSNVSIDIYIGLTKKTKNSINLINGFPYIKSKVYVTGNIMSLDEDLDYSNRATLQIIEQYANSYLEQNISAFLYKTAKEYKSDICNFGIHALKNYLTWDEWLTSDWESNYQNSFFNIEVNTTVQSGLLFTKT